MNMRNTLGRTFVVPEFVVVAVRKVEGKELVLGVDNYWSVPYTDKSFYSSWALTQTFVVGDILVLNFTNGEHDVGQVNKADYDSRNPSANTISMSADSPFRFTIPDTKDYYFLCTFFGHCAAEQKLAITNVQAASGAPASLAPTPSTKAPSPSPPGSSPPSLASSLASSLSIVIIPIAVSLFC